MWTYKIAIKLPFHSSELGFGMESPLFSLPDGINKMHVMSLIACQSEMIKATRLKSTPKLKSSKHILVFRFLRGFCTRKGKIVAGSTHMHAAGDACVREHSILALPGIQY